MERHSLRRRMSFLSNIFQSQVSLKFYSARQFCGTDITQKVEIFLLIIIEKIEQNDFITQLTDKQKYRLQKSKLSKNILIVSSEFSF